MSLSVGQVRGPYPGSSEQRWWGPLPVRSVSRLSAVMFPVPGWTLASGPVGVGLALADVGEAVGVSPTACCSDVGAELWLIGAALSGALACAACVWVEACEVADVGAAV